MNEFVCLEMLLHTEKKAKPTNSMECLRPQSKKKKGIATKKNIEMY